MLSRPRRIEVRSLDRCVRCQWDLRPGDVAVWDPAQREVLCVECGSRQGAASSSIVAQAIRAGATRLGGIRAPR